MGIADRDYMYTRREPVSRSAPPPRGGGLSRLASTATILSVIAAVATRMVSLYGIPSFDRPAGPILSFPNSGDVFVTPYADLQHGQSRFRVQVPLADHSNYVVLLTDAVSGRRIMAIYCRSGDDVTVPVPPLTYRVRVASGLDWVRSARPVRPRHSCRGGGSEHGCSGGSWDRHRVPAAARR